MDLVGKSSTSFDKYFRKLKSADPKVCEFLLEKVLNPNSAYRARMVEIVDFCEGLQGPTSTGEAKAKAAFKALAGDSENRDRVFELLEKERSPGKA
jgi:hypothetical protein